MNVPFRIAVGVLIAASPLLLSACSPVSPTTDVDDSAAVTASATPSDEASAPSAEASDPGEGNELSAACGQLADLRSANLASSNQKATQVSVSDLPFTLTATGSVYCVMSFATVDTDQHLAIEVIADDTGGNGPFVFSSSPDLTVTPCATSTPLMCFAGPDDVYVSVSATEGLDFFPSQQLVSAYVMGG